MNQRSLAKLPFNWCWTQLSEISEAVTGNTPPTINMANYGGIIPFVKPPQLANGGIWSAPETLTKSGAEFARLLPVGSVLVSCIGNLGKTAIARVLCATNQQINALIFEAEMSPEYGWYYAQTLQPWLMSVASATTVAIVNKSKFQGAPFPLPPAAEQTRIVDKLEELLSDLDAGVAELKAAQKKLVQYRQALLKAAVEGRLTEAWRAQRGPDAGSEESGAQLLARILRERRARWEAKQLAKFAAQAKLPPTGWQQSYREPVHANSEHLRALPANWVWANIEQLGDVQLGRQRSPDKMRGISPTKYIRAANVTELGVDFEDVLSMDFSESERATFELKAGDVLLTEASGSPEHVGRPVVWPEPRG